jgi:hypothetical protein
LKEKASLEMGRLFCLWGSDLWRNVSVIYRVKL